MILAIDIGNTHIVLGCVNADNQVEHHLQLSTNKTETAYEYAAEIKSILDLEKIDPAFFDGAIISSVVPNVTVVIGKAVEILTGQKPLILGQGVKINLAIDMNGITADQIAGDLLASSVAAKESYPLPAVIIDIGTATTMVVVSGAGAYIGGVILPGPGTAMKGMLERTALLPDVDFIEPDRAIPKDTVNAIRGGIMYGSAGALDGILDHFEAELGEQPTVLATGGMGHIIAPLCRHRIIVDNDLLLKGLGQIWRDNQK